MLAGSFTLFLGLAWLWISVDPATPVSMTGVSGVLIRMGCSALSSWICYLGAMMLWNSFHDYWDFCHKTN
jgi:hypothetical protein